MLTSDPDPFTTWRHVVTDSVYVVLGVGVCSTNGPREGVERSVVYYSVDRPGLRYREVSEFLDGRFVEEGTGPRR